MCLFLFLVLFNCRQKCDNDKMQFHVKAIKIKLVGNRQQDCSSYKKCAWRKIFFDGILYAISLKDLFLGTVQILIIRFFKLKSERRKKFFWMERPPHCFIFILFSFSFLCHSRTFVLLCLMRFFFFLFPPLFWMKKNKTQRKGKWMKGLFVKKQ